MSNNVFPAQVRGLAYTVVKSQENSAIIQESPTFVSTRILQSQNPRWHWRLEYSVVFDSILNPNPQLTYTDLQTMLGFCQAMYSNKEDFLYLDPDDNFVGPGVITAVWQANYPYMLGAIIVSGGHGQQVIAVTGSGRSGLTTPTFGGTVTDGGLTWLDIGPYTGVGYPNPQTQLQVVTDGTNYYSPIQRNLGGQFYEDITDLQSPLTIYANGTLTTSFGIAWGGLVIPGFSTSGLYITWGTTPPIEPVTATFNYYFRVRLEDPIQDFEKFVDHLWAMGGEQNVQGKGYLKFKSSPPISSTGPNSPPSPFPFIPPISTPVGQKVAVIYPQSYVANNGSGSAFAGPSGLAFGQAGSNAFGFAELMHQYLGSTGGNVIFSNYTLPAYIPPAQVTHIFTSTPMVIWTLTGNVGFSGISTFSPLYSIFAPADFQGSTTIGAKTFITFTFDTLPDWNAFGHTTASFAYNLIQQKVIPFASLQGQYNFITVMFPSLVIYYT